MTVTTLPDVPFSLGPEMTIALAAGHRDALLQALESGSGDFVLDLGGVTDFDSSGVQLLIALRHSLAGRGRALRLVDASPAVADALQVFGIEALFPLAPLTPITH
jgi:anti-anti-sigma factor